MSVQVVDSSGAVKWYVPEVHHDLAGKRLDKDRELHPTPFGDHVRHVTRT